MVLSIAHPPPVQSHLLHLLYPPPPADHAYPLLQLPHLCDLIRIQPQLDNVRSQLCLQLRQALRGSDAFRVLDVCTILCTQVTDKTSACQLNIKSATIRPVTPMQAVQPKQHEIALLQCIGGCYKHCGIYCACSVRAPCLHRQGVLHQPRHTHNISQWGIYTHPPVASVEAAWQ